MSWAAGTLYGFDVESTGTDVFNDRIVTATIPKVINGEVADLRSWTINPGIAIPPAATAIHGITDADVADGMDPALGVADIADTVTGILRAGLPLVVFNAAYDLSILEVECRRHGIPGLDGVPLHSVIDPMVLGKGMDMVNRRFRKGQNYKLPSLCERYGVPFVESHDATADATGTVLLAVAIANAETYLAQMGPAQIHQTQVTWRREMQHSLRQYFDKNGIEHDGVDGSWPLHTDLMGATA